jgi:hypothetical protein
VIERHLADNTLLQNYTAVLEILLRLRQVRAACCACCPQCAQHDKALRLASVSQLRIMPAHTAARPLACYLQICCHASLAPGDVPAFAAQLQPAGTKLTPEVQQQLVQLLKASVGWQGCLGQGCSYSVQK